MTVPRLIPLLLIQDGSLVKTVRFENPKYLGDPINTVHIFNANQVDELSIIDISARKNGNLPNFALLQRILNEAFMPISYGGGISDMSCAEKLFRIGFEKILVDSLLHESPMAVREMSLRFGAQAICGVVTTKKVNQKMYSYSFKKSLIPLDEHLEVIKESNVGEVLILDSDREGTKEGYDIELLRFVKNRLDIPIVACGGAESLHGISKTHNVVGASGYAVGTLFTLHGPRRSVLVSYPSRSEIENLF